MWVLLDIVVVVLMIGSFLCNCGRLIKGSKLKVCNLVLVVFVGFDFFIF